MKTSSGESQINLNFYKRKPHEFIEAWLLNSGARIVMRPVQPQDGPMLNAMVERLSSWAKYYRFHAGVHHLPANQSHYMSCVDQKHHVAFVLTTKIDEREHIIADARYVVDKNSADDSAEFSIVVEDHWQRFGLAEHAMRTLIAAAGYRGLCWLHGDILAENCPMLALMKRLQFCCTPDILDESMVHAELMVRSPRKTWGISAQLPSAYLRHHIELCRGLVKQLLVGRHA